MEAWIYAAVALAAYFLGSIPTGYIVAKAKGVDIRSAGSGNIGATNVFRVLGKTAGIIVLVIDASKGFLAPWFAPAFASALSSGALTGEQVDYVSIIAGIGVILGHNYTCWLKFKGGKGIATSAGAVLALFPAAFAVVLVLWLVVFGISKYVSLASLAAAVALPLTAWLLHSSARMTWLAIFMSALAIYKHKANIKRLMDGTENRFGGMPPPVGVVK